MRINGESFTFYFSNNLQTFITPIFFVIRKSYNKSFEQGRIFGGR